MVNHCFLLKRVLTYIFIVIFPSGLCRVRKEERKKNVLTLSKYVPQSDEPFRRNCPVVTLKSCD